MECKREGDVTLGVQLGPFIMMGNTWAGLPCQKSSRAPFAVYFWAAGCVCVCVFSFGHVDLEVSILVRNL